MRKKSPKNPNLWVVESALHRHVQMHLSTATTALYFIHQALQSPQLHLFASFTDALTHPYAV